MKAFLAKAKGALDKLDDANAALASELGGITPDHQLPKSVINKLRELAEDIPTAITALEFSIELMDKTSLDIVDMETRLQSETGRLADTLSEIGDTVYGSYFVRERFKDHLNTLDEHANTAASDLFPSGVQGLNKVNSKLWEFTKRQMMIYRDTLKKVGLKLKPDERDTIQTRFVEFGKPFDALNGFLNDLALRSLDGPGVEARFEYTVGDLNNARETLRAALNLELFRPFESILKAGIAIAETVESSLKSLHIPILPNHTDIEELSACIGDKLYSDLTGLQAFALLNISSRMRSIEFKGKHLLSPEFGVEIFKPFPDRFYFRANESFLSLVTRSGLFVPADASLHKYRAGGWKQNRFSEGNLQICHGPVVNKRFEGEADIDLYRNPVRHLFGEVLHNHLTGRKTDAYKVRRVLDGQGVKPIGGFHIFNSA